MASDFFEGVRRIYEENRKGLYTYALSLAGDPEEAQDAVQAAFFAILRRNRLPKNSRPYVFRCVRNAVIDNGRKERSRKSNGKRSVKPTTTEQHPVRYRALQQCLARISQGEREAIVLKTYGGLAFREIAEITGVSINTIASRYRRGLGKMRALLEEAP